MTDNLERGVEVIERIILNDADPDVLSDIDRQGKSYERAQN